MVINIRHLANPAVFRSGLVIPGTDQGYQPRKVMEFGLEGARSVGPKGQPGQAGPGRALEFIQVVPHEGHFLRLEPALFDI